MVKANSLKEKCNSCHSTKSKEFWSFEEDEDEIVLCDTCYEEYKDELHKAIDNQSKSVFTGSVGWLVFWLIVAFPIGIIWLIFGMEKGEVHLRNVLKRIKHS